MVTDRVSTGGLIMLLYVQLIDPNEVNPMSLWFKDKLGSYSNIALLAVFLVVLDIGSHWFHVQSVSAHHKSHDATKGRNALLQWYYSIYPLFAYCCVSAEVTYVVLVVLMKGVNPTLFSSFTLMDFWQYVCVPGCVLKQLVNVVQLWSAAEALASIDVIPVPSSSSSNSSKKGN